MDKTHMEGQFFDSKHTHGGHDHNICGEHCQALHKNDLIGAFGAIHLLNIQIKELKGELKKSKQRNNLSINLLSHFKKEMWGWSITMAIVTGFALGGCLILLSKIS